MYVVYSFCAAWYQMTHRRYRSVAGELGTAGLKDFVSPYLINFLFNNFTLLLTNDIKVSWK